MTARRWAWFWFAAFAAVLALLAWGALHRAPACPLGDTACAQCASLSPARVQQCLDCLSLSPSQCAALTTSAVACCGPAADGSDVAAVQARLRTALRAQPCDAGAVQRLTDELVRARAAAIRAGVEAALRLRDVLTPAQFAAFLQQVPDR